MNSASSGEFLYQLGLRNGDRPLSVNGYPLDTWAETFLAYGSLYLSGETSYSVVVRRGTSNITFLYEIT